jgi:threonine dehydratase
VTATAVTAGLPRRTDVEEAARRIAGHVRRTPLLDVVLEGRRVVLKLEQTQVTGTFKARGATNAVLSRDPGPQAVVAASGGNHGLGVAYAAARIGAHAIVVVPETVPESKAAALEAARAEVVRRGREYFEAEAYARELAERRGLPFVHPFADPAVIAGQGTLTLEILADAPAGLDAVVVGVGGGGLLAGTALACSGTAVAAVGAEPEGAPTLSRALRAGEPVDVELDTVTASALGARRTHPLTLAVISEHAREVTLVDDREVLAARDLLWSQCRLAVEPAGAAGLAAVLAGKVAADLPCVVLCGANSTWRPGRG